MSAIVVARGLGKRFGRLLALAPLDLALAPGARLAVLGPNGAGKSTLLRLLAGLTRPSSGRVEVPGASGPGRRALRARVGYVGHESLLYPALSARENLRFAARLYGVRAVDERIEGLIREFALSAHADRPTGSFSRGLAQRAALARALVHEPTLLLLDEPFSGLDADASERLRALLGGLATAERALVVVTHDLDAAGALASDALVLCAGRHRQIPAPLGADLRSAYAGAVAELGSAA